jgi:hypothetical protein
MYMNKRAIRNDNDNGYNDQNIVSPGTSPESIHCRNTV